MNFFADEITTYRRLARQHHPDLGGSEEMMKALNNIRVVSSPTVGSCRITYRYLVYAEAATGRDRRLTPVDVMFTLDDLQFSTESLAHHRLVNRLVKAAMPGFYVPLRDGWVVEDNSAVPF